MSLVSALGQMVQIPQWFVWRLQWDAEAGKYHKTPCTPDGPWIIDASQPHNWLGFERAHERQHHMSVAQPEHKFALGFWLTADTGYWFLDIDKCIGPDGAYSALANEWGTALAGCFIEFSSSGNGLHIIGRGEIPPHSMRNKTTGAELYTADRGIAFGLSGEAWGSADQSSSYITAIAQQYFPPRVAGEDGQWNQPRADYRCSLDDAALIAKMLGSASVAAKFGNRASFAQLWANAPELDKFYGPDSASERDAALAAHLAFWTGCDAPRMERLMRMSSLVRPKWDEHRTYLRELTIEGACARQGDVYKESERANPAQLYAFTAPPLPPAVGVVDAAPVLMVSPEAKATIDGLLEMIHSSSSWDDVHNRVIPAVRAAGVPSVLMARIENAINKRLDLWDAKLPVAKLRALINPPRVADDAADGADELGVPDWMAKYVYVQQGDKFHNTITGIGMSRTSFNATHDRDMPIKGDGPFREDAVQWALHRWAVPMVHDTIYYPGKPAIVEYDGLTWANSYAEASHPAIEAYTAAGIDAINRFNQHMWLLCGQREAVYANLMAFLAYNVQHPGRKIRWCPIIKGAPGDGKSMIGRLLDAAMGGRNVMSIGPEIVANTGGFTDWAHGRAVVVLEELYMIGKDRYRIANAFKTYVSNEKVTINGKGDKPKYVINTCNQIALTNYGDAVPIEADNKDRRWFVIFTPFETRAQLHAALGYASDDAAGRNHFDVIFDSFAREPGQWRNWLMSWPIPATFSADSAAMETAEKASMAAAGVDDVESIARLIVEEGAFGVSRQALSSACLTSAMRQQSFTEGVEIPKGHGVTYLLNRMGFVKVEKSLKWNNGAHRVWIKPGVSTDPEVLRALLTATATKTAT